MLPPMRRLAFLALILASAAHGETPDEVVSGRFLPGWRQTDGQRMAAIDLTLAPGWKTYWRAPGEAGIPPEFDWSGSRNVKSVRLIWPSPRVIALNGMESIGYLDGLTLPVEVQPEDPTQPVRLALTMQLGVCHDICMPAELRLQADLSGPGAPDSAIAAALHAVPLSPDEAGLAGLDCALTPIDDGLRLTARLDLPPQGGVERVVFESADPGIWVSESTGGRQGGQLSATVDLVPPDGKPFALDRSGLTVTVLADTHSVEIHGCPAP